MCLTLSPIKQQSRIPTSLSSEWKKIGYLWSLQDSSLPDLLTLWVSLRMCLVWTCPLLENWQIKGFDTVRCKTRYQVCGGRKSIMRMKSAVKDPGTFPWQNLHGAFELFTFAENFQGDRVNTEEMNPCRIKLLLKNDVIPYTCGQKNV